MPCLRGVSADKVYCSQPCAVGQAPRAGTLAAILKERFMYVGRIVAVGKTQEDRLVVMYRVSSRSFPNRRAAISGQTISIVPKEGFESDIYKNPYISYNCLRITNTFAIVGNGSHTDPIAEKLGSGMRMRDAMVSVLSGLDYEHDDYNTPRIAAIIDKRSRICAIGIIRSDALLVKEINLEKGEISYLATYEHNYPDKSFGDTGFNVSSSGEACEYILGKGVFADLERPVVAGCAIEDGTTFSIAIKDAVLP
jgi:IMP cyclohydrolase